MTKLTDLRLHAADTLSLHIHNRTMTPHAHVHGDDLLKVVDALADYTIAKATEQLHDNLNVTHDPTLLTSKTPPQTPRPPTP